MAGARLICRGTAWPSARVAPVIPPAEPGKRGRTVSAGPPLPRAVSAGPPLPRAVSAGPALPRAVSAEGRQGRGGDLGPAPWPLIEAPSGQGRKWTADVAEGFWRDFATLNLFEADAAGAVAFVRRRGDPEGLLTRPFVSVDVGRWVTPLHDGLRRFAASWSEPDADGVSRCDHDSSAAVEFWRLSLFPAVKAQIEVVPAPDDGVSLALTANTLGAFMALSAADALGRRVPMRRCEYCSSWFELRRKDMRFCSATCRAAMFNAVKERGEA